MKKKYLLVAALAVLLAAAGALLYVFTNLDSIVKSAIEKYGSEATKTAVRVSSVRITLSTGEGAVSGLTIADPPGFDPLSIMKLDRIAVRIPVKSVTAAPLVIDNILISGPEVFYEMNKDGTANVDVLKKNLSASAPSRKKAEVPDGSRGGEIRLRVKRLVFEKGKVHLHVAGLTDKPVVVDLPRLVMTDIGGRDGAPPAEIARTVVAALAEETVRTAARQQGERLLRKGAEDLINRYLNK